MSTLLNRETYLVRLFSDFCLIFATFVITSVISDRGVFQFDRELLIVLITGWYISSKLINIYDDFRTVRFIDEFLLLFPVVLIQVLMLVVFLFFMDQRHFARTFVAEYSVLLMFLMSVKKYVFKKVFQYFRKRGRNRRNLLIVGSTEIGTSFHDFIHQNPQFGYNSIGFVDNRKNPAINGLYKGNLDELDNVISLHRVDEIIIALPEFDKESINRIILTSDRNAIRTRIIPDYFTFNSNRYKMESFGAYQMVSVRTEPLKHLHWRIVKRLIDLCISLLVTVFIFSWLFPIIALLIKLDSKGSVFYIQDRWGKNNKVIRCLKFRTMKANSDVLVNGQLPQATKNDDRITKLGSFLRKTNLDELPQFLNVIWGDMSVVGPRPHAVPHNIANQEFIDNYSIRHWVKPGITGWAQANGLRGETKNKDLMKKRVSHDIWYIENWTPLLDLKIMLMTAYNMVKGEDMAY
ncbi:putative colanic acid biosysnthesis UDP-glucose lipid carrier transferase [Pseudarcicella hirudinis]|uniref:Putative colanic acid biosysnthesis UDP-glucose lipid carrier transferase n=1 Tax=Pseudarcicella hirudinis TaxID=1079859 RepID=A0A1I5YPT7_9BACT|nr:undecaprenyl-phosphate glucose phosphotransferase [Pseudarcicella hirudinis]SFQ46100.1 putative colanic acid biosysnthesis UDP-glucose lipid carrier transferase [Pseudarcicella hirudinis]